MELETRQQKLKDAKERTGGMSFSSISTLDERFELAAALIETMKKGIDAGDWSFFEEGVLEFANRLYYQKGTFGESSIVILDFIKREWATYVGSNPPRLHKVLGGYNHALNQISPLTMCFTNHSAASGTNFRPDPETENLTSGLSWFFNQS